MARSYDGSLLKSLAVAFGDGLAFGVGMKIAQVSKTARAPSDLIPISNRLEHVEDRIQKVETTGLAAQLGSGEEQSLDQHVLDRVVAALEARLAEHSGQVERRLAEMEAKLALELKGLDNRHTVQAGKTLSVVDEVRTSLKNEIDTLAREAGATISRLEQQVTAVESTNRGHAERFANVEQRLTSTEQRLKAELEAYLDARIHALEERLHADITEAGTRTADLLVQTIETRILQQITALEETVVKQSETIRTLHARSTVADRNLEGLIAGFGRLCDQAIRQLRQEPAESPADEADPPDPPSVKPGPEVPVDVGPENPDTAPSASGTASPEGVGLTAPQDDDHLYDSLNLLNDRPQRERRWRIPLVSALFVAALGLGAWQFTGGPALPSPAGQNGTIPTVSTVSQLAHGAFRLPAVPRFSFR